MPSLNAPAPNFELFNLEGNAVQLIDYSGKPVLLNFWATWCSPCRLEMATFQSQYDKYAGDLVILAVNNAEDFQDVQAFVDELELTFEVLLDPKAEIQSQFKIHGYPTTIFIDSDGIIRARHIGLITADQLERYLMDLGLGNSN